MPLTLTLSPSLIIMFDATDLLNFFIRLPGLEVANPQCAAFSRKVGECGRLII